MRGGAEEKGFWCRSVCMWFGDRDARPGANDSKKESPIDQEERKENRGEGRKVP